MSASQRPNPHKSRFLWHCLSSVLMCIAAFIWAPKSAIISFALLGASGLYAFAARREFELSEQENGLPVRATARLDRDIFKR